MLQLAATPGDHDASDQLLGGLIVAVIFDFGKDRVNDLRAARVDDAAQVLETNLLRIASTQTWNGNDFILLVLSRPRTSKANLEGFRLLFDDGTAFFDVAGDDVAPMRNDGRMANDAILENGHIGRATSDIHQDHTGFLLFLAQHGIRAGKGLQVDGVQVQIRTLHTPRDVLDAGQLTHHDVEGGLQTSAVHAPGLLDVTLAIHFVLLRQDVDDFFTGHHGKLVDVFGQAVQIGILNHLLRIFAGDVIRMLQAANMLPSNTHGDGFDVQTGTLLCELHRFFDGLNRLGDVDHHTALDTQTRCRTVPNDFNFTKFIVASDEGDNFGGSDVEADSNTVGFHRVNR